MSVNRNLNKILRFTNNINAIRRGTIGNRLRRKLIKNAAKTGIRNLFR